MSKEEKKVQNRSNQWLHKMDFDPTKLKQKTLNTNTKDEHNFLNHKIWVQGHPPKFSEY